MDAAEAFSALEEALEGAGGVLATLGAASNLSVLVEHNDETTQLLAVAVVASADSHNELTLTAMLNQQLQDGLFQQTAAATGRQLQLITHKLQASQGKLPKATELHAAHVLVLVLACLPALWRRSTPDMADDMFQELQAAGLLPVLGQAMSAAAEALRGQLSASNSGSSGSASNTSAGSGSSGSSGSAHSARTSIGQLLIWLLGCVFAVAIFIALVFGWDYTVLQPQARAQPQAQQSQQHAQPEQQQQQSQHQPQPQPKQPQHSQHHPDKQQQLDQQSQHQPEQQQPDQQPEHQRQQSQPLDFESIKQLVAYSGTLLQTWYRLNKGSGTTCLAEPWPSTCVAYASLAAAMLEVLPVIVATPTPVAAQATAAAGATATPGAGQSAQNTHRRQSRNRQSGTASSSGAALNSRGAASSSSAAAIPAAGWEDVPAHAVVEVLTAGFCLSVHMGIIVNHQRGQPNYWSMLGSADVLRVVMFFAAYTAGKQHTLQHGKPAAVSLSGDSSNSNSSRSSKTQQQPQGATHTLPSYHNALAEGLGSGLVALLQSQEVLEVARKSVLPQAGGLRVTLETLRFLVRGAAADPGVPLDILETYCGEELNTPWPPAAFVNLPHEQQQPLLLPLAQTVLEMLLLLGVEGGEQMLHNGLDLLQHLLSTLHSSQATSDKAAAAAAAAAAATQPPGYQLPALVLPVLLLLGAIVMQHTQQQLQNALGSSGTGSSSSSGSTQPQAAHAPTDPQSIRAMQLYGQVLASLLACCKGVPSISLAVAFMEQPGLSAAICEAVLRGQCDRNPDGKEEADNSSSSTSSGSSVSGSSGSWETSSDGGCATSSSGSWETMSFSSLSRISSGCTHMPDVALANLAGNVAAAVRTFTITDSFSTSTASSSSSSQGSQGSGQSADVLPALVSLLVTCLKVTVRTTRATAGPWVAASQAWNVLDAALLLGGQVQLAAGVASAGGGGAASASVSSSSSSGTAAGDSSSAAAGNRFLYDQLKSGSLAWAGLAARALSCVGQALLQQGRVGEDSVSGDGSDSVGDDSVDSMVAEAAAGLRWQQVAPSVLAGTCVRALNSLMQQLEQLQQWLPAADVSKCLQKAQAAVAAESFLEEELHASSSQPRLESEVSSSSEMCKDGGQRVPGSWAADVGGQLAALGQQVASLLPCPFFCNNTACTTVWAWGPQGQPAGAGSATGAAAAAATPTGTAAAGSVLSEQALVARGLCSGCQVAKYCSAECHSEHWRQRDGGHKAVCKVLRAARARR